MAVLQYFRRLSDPAVLVLPTGAGKSLVIAELARLARGAEHGAAMPGAIGIDNSGAREAAGERFVSVLRKAVALADVAGTI